MSISRCCECSKKAVRMIDTKYYCGDCAPNYQEKEIELDMAHPDWEPKCETKKKEGFWDKVARWFNDSNCGCGCK